MIYGIKSQIIIYRFKDLIDILIKYFTMKRKNELELILEDWKMTKDRIRHFDDIIMRIRVQSLPISIGLFLFAFSSRSLTGVVKLYIWAIHVSSLALIFTGLYLIPIALLDFLHYRLLLKSVDHAKELENKYFEGNIEITNILTSPYLTHLHSCAVILFYCVLIGLSFYLAYILI